MNQQKQDKEMAKSIIVFLMSIPIFMFGIFGGFIGLMDDNSNFLSGFLWGIGIGIVILVIGFAGMYIWEWIKKEAYKGKLFPFLLVGFLAAIAISGYLALNLGNPTCIDSETDNRGSTCLEYADDGFEATDEQKWEKFWSTLPVTTIITSLVAYIVRQNMEKDNKK